MQTVTFKIPQQKIQNLIDNISQKIMRDLNTRVENFLIETAESQGVPLDWLSENYIVEIRQVIHVPDGEHVRYAPPEFCNYYELRLVHRDLPLP